MSKLKRLLLFLIIPASIGIATLLSLWFIPKEVEKAKNKAENPDGKSNITINMRIPDWDNNQTFDDKKYNKDLYIRNWEFTGSETKEMMVPFYIDTTWTLDHTDVYTMGDAMDEINKQEPETFKFNIAKSKAGPMGRMIWGVKKSNYALNKQQNKSRNQYWGMHEEKNIAESWVYKQDIMGDQNYLSISSPNNKFAQKDSHKTFDKNESFFPYDERFPVGIDNIYISSNDILNINMWKII